MAEPAKKPSFTPLKTGLHVHWPYRGAVGDGIVLRVDKLGTDNDTTRYLVRELDHHPGEKSILKHYGAVLKPGWDHH